MTEIIIRELVEADYDAVSNIFKQGIETKNATFETSIPTWTQWNQGHLEKCRLAACLNDEVVGWAVLSPFSSRYTYRGVAEVSIYVSANHLNKGIGKKLLEALIKESEENGIWTLYASIFPENVASIKIHKNSGFREIGYHEKISMMDEVWRNTIIFERRSKKF